MKIKSIIRIVVWVLVIMMLLSVLNWFLRFDSRSDRGYSDRHVHRLAAGESSLSPMSFSPEEIQNLAISWVSGDITIVPADVKEITVQEGSSSHPMTTWFEGSTLVIEFTEKLGSLFNFDIGSKDLTITVPKNWELDSLSIDAASSSLLVQDLKIESVNVETASGECRFENCQVDSMDVSSASGSIYFTGTLEDLECSCASADLDIQVQNVPKEISVSSMSGDLNLTLPENAGFTAELSGLSNSFHSDFPAVFEDGTYRYGDGKCEIEMDGMSSGLYIHSAQRNLLPNGVEVPDFPDPPDLPDLP